MALILEMLADGEPLERILEGYPHISREDVLACLSFAAMAMQKETGPMEPALAAPERSPRMAS